MCTLPRPCENKVWEGKQQTTTVKINGRKAQALLDTGSVQTLIHPTLVQQELPLDKPVLNISCVHGDCKAYPVTVVYLEVSGQKYLISVGVVESLSFPVILGQDVPILQELVQTCKPVNIVTRSQGQKQKEEEQCNEQVPKAESGVSAVPKLISEHMYENQNGAEDQSKPSDIFSELPFFAEVLPEVAIKARKSKRQRRIDKMTGTIKNIVELPVPGSGETVQEDYSELQKQDVTLEGPFKQAAEVQPSQLIEED